MKITLSHCINDIPAESWNSLTEERLYISHGWLQVFEQTAKDKVKPFYFMLEDDGDLVGIAVCYETQKNNPFDLLNAYMLGQLESVAARIGLSFNPAFLCGPIRGNGDHIIVREEISKQKRMSYIRCLMDEVERSAEKKQLPLFYIHISEHESELREELTRRRYNESVVHPRNRLYVKWQSFSDYLADRNTLTKKDARAFKYQINKNKKAGVIIKQIEKLENEALLYKLLSEHHYRLNAQPFPYSNDFLSALKKHLGSDVIILVAEKKEKVIGVAVIFKRSTEGWVVFVGMDYKVSDNDFSYFNLTYYHAIDHAIQVGIKSLNYGTMVYRLKKRRGCTLENSYVFHRSPVRVSHFLLKPWFYLHRTWYEKRKIPKVISRL